MNATSASSQFLSLLKAPRRPHRVIFCAVAATLLLQCTGANGPMGHDVVSDLHDASDVRTDVAMDAGSDVQSMDIPTQDRVGPDATDAQNVADVGDVRDARADAMVDVLFADSDAGDSGVAMVDVFDVPNVDVPNRDVPNVADVPSAPACRPPNGNACPMGVAMQQPVCPAACTGGCMGATCIVDCSAVGACQFGMIHCPPGMRCQVQCTGLSSCQFANITCDDDSPCDVNCGFTSTCQFLQMHCPARASCNLGCSGISSCQQGSVACGGGACNLDCSGESASVAHLNCGDSCSCGSSCGCDP